MANDIRRIKDLPIVTDILADEVIPLDGSRGTKSIVLKDILGNIYSNADKAKVDKLITTGTGDKYLADDGIYKDLSDVLPDIIPIPNISLNVETRLNCTKDNKWLYMLVKDVGIVPMVDTILDVPHGIIGYQDIGISLDNSYITNDSIQYKLNDSLYCRVSITSSSGTLKDRIKIEPINGMEYDNFHIFIAFTYNKTSDPIVVNTAMLRSGGSPISTDAIIYPDGRTLTEIITQLL